MKTSQTLSDSSSLVAEYFKTLRRYCRLIAQNREIDPTYVQQDVAVCLSLSVQCVEVFLNVYFRRLVESERFSHARDELLKDQENWKFGLERKMDKWPTLLFSRSAIDLKTSGTPCIAKGSGVGQSFERLRRKRNALMHFKNQDVSVTSPDGGVVIHGLSDTTDYHSLTETDAHHALEVAESFVCEVFKMQGLDHAQLPIAMFRWTGKSPAR